MIQELPGPIIRRRLGSDDPVRVWRGAIVRVAGNPRRVVRPRGGAEGGIRSGNGELAPNYLPGRVKSLVKAGGFLCLD